MRVRDLVAVACVLLLPALARADHAAATPEAAEGAAAERPPLYSDLGNWSHAITTSVPNAQKFFDQGLRLCYGFNHAEAIRAF